MTVAMCAMQVPRASTRPSASATGRSARRRLGAANVLGSRAIAPSGEKARIASGRSAGIASVTAGPARSRNVPSPVQPGDVVPDAFRYVPSRGSTVGGAGGVGAVAGKSTGGTGEAAVGEKKKLRVAYQGMPGAYSEAAALTAYPNCDPCPCEQFENAFEVRPPFPRPTRDRLTRLPHARPLHFHIRSSDPPSLPQATEQWTADRAVLPFENSLGGSIHRNYDLILNHRLHIVGEVYFKVRHCLLALPGQTKEDIARAQSHPQALAQCDGYLTELNGGVIKEAVDDTAGAAAHIAQNQLKGVAAVASRRAAELYNMEVLEEDIQDDKSNVTRFLALAREPLPPREGVPYKTSIAFSMKECSGALFKALACFALRDINLTKVESRPMRWKPVTQSDQDGRPMQFSYLFYVDFEASMADENAQNALRQLQENATFLRVLGSYPADDSKL